MAFGAGGSTVRCSAILPYAVALVLFAVPLVLLPVLRHPSNVHIHSLALKWRAAHAHVDDAPPLLKKVFAAVTFHYDVQNLVYLKLVSVA